jgi:hypothetical protein
MRTTYRPRCAQRAPKPQPIEAWAREVIAEPAAFCASGREAALIGRLLAELEASR